MNLGCETLLHLNQLPTRPTSYSLPREVRVVGVVALTRLLAQTLEVARAYEFRTTSVAAGLCKPLASLFHRHYQEQIDAISVIADRIERLGGASLGTSAFTEASSEFQDGGFELETNSPINILYVAHETISCTARRLAQIVYNAGDVETRFLIVERILRLNEFHRWRLSSHIDQS